MSNSVSRVFPKTNISVWGQSPLTESSLPNVLRQVYKPRLTISFLSKASLTKPWAIRNFVHVYFGRRGIGEGVNGDCAKRTSQFYELPFRASAMNS